MILEFKYPGIFLAALIVLIFFAVRFYSANDGMTGWTKRILFALKFLFLAMIALLIFSPEIVRTGVRTVPERHLVMFDDSRSMALNNPADTVMINDIYESIKNDDSFISSSFGKTTEILNDSYLSFADSFTIISDGYTERMTEDLAESQNVRSIILVTDGNFTVADNFTLKGSLPVNVVYSSVRSDDPDIYIEDLIYENDPDGKDSYFTVKTGFTGQSSEKEFLIDILENGKVLKTLKGKIPEKGSFTSVRTELPDFKNGTRETEFVIGKLKEEKNTYNNKKTAYQKKDPAAERILIVSKGPSFDLAFLTKMLRIGGYRFTSVYENAFGDSLKASDFGSLIAIGSPSIKADARTIELMKKFSSRLFFITRSTDRIKLSSLTGGGFDFRAFSDSEGRLSENTGGEGGYLLTRSSQPVILDGLPDIVYNQMFIADEKTYRPLLLISPSSKTAALYKKNGIKECLLLANFSSFWKAAFNDPDEHFSNLMFNIADLLSADRSFDRIRVNTQKEQYYSGEKAAFKGPILDSKLEPVSKAEAVVSISESSLSAPLIFNGRDYFAELYIDKPGKYTAKIIVKEDGGGEIKKLIPFRIVENDLETRLIGTDTSFVKNFASSRKGTAVPLSGAAEFLDLRRGKTEEISEIERTDITGNKYFFIIMALVFISELALRKYKDLS
ncbi:MAG TPA: hypothetical protein PLP37_07275 [Clostridiales bacterium]|nr:hypothetical protein [Clostridiales bacterium]